MKGKTLDQHDDTLVIEPGHVALYVRFNLYEECDHTVDTTLIVQEEIADDLAALEEFLREEGTWLDDFNPLACVNVTESRISDVRIVRRRGPVRTNARTEPEHGADLRQRYVLAGHWPAEHATTIADNGWAVANAPRPLSGPLNWTGEFYHGIFYAAGPLQELAGRWRADDATLLVPITPADAVAKLKDAVAGKGYDWNVVVDSCPEQLQMWAEDLQLPWDPAWADRDSAAAQKQADDA
ncbi:hypothetical protein [Nonomuraea sp. NPDC049400]|uniref:hypothetical protein n=1 Tax=Nonomuraea sp. NPDC049400 TaxID=3364352 RepID=UPI0037A6D24F